MITLTLHKTDTAPAQPNYLGSDRPTSFPLLTWSETAECTCPDPCERDHERD